MFLDIKGTLWALAAVLLLSIWLMHGCQSRFERRREYRQQRQEQFHQWRQERQDGRDQWHWGDRWRKRFSGEQSDDLPAGDNPGGAGLADDRRDADRL